jgi:hypothetical protein
MGKTKTCFSWALKHYCLIFHSIFDRQGYPFDPILKHIQDFLHQNFVNAKQEVQVRYHNELATCFTYNQRLIFLWIYAHIEFFRDFLSHGKK